MGNVFDDIRERSEAIGEARGEAIGEARGEARGEAIGEARGKAIGAHSACIEVAERMIQQGNIIFEEIANFTGLSLTEINNLAQKGNN